MEETMDKDTIRLDGSITVKEACDEVKSIADKKTKNLIYYHILATEAFWQYLNDNDLVNCEPVNLRSSSRFLSEFEITDIQLPNLSIYVRAAYDEDILFIPKKHFDYNLTPDIYLFVKVDEELQTGKILGCITPDMVNKMNDNGTYYFVNRAFLKPFEELVSAIKNNPAKDRLMISDKAEETLKKFIMSYIDNDIDRNKINKLTDYLKNSVIAREMLVEFENFERLSYMAINEFKDLDIENNDFSKYIKTLIPSDEFSAFVTDDNIEVADNNEHGGLFIDDDLIQEKSENNIENTIQEVTEIEPSNDEFDVFENAVVEDFTVEPAENISNAEEAVMEEVPEVVQELDITDESETAQETVSGAVAETEFETDVKAEPEPELEKAEESAEIDVIDEEINDIPEDISLTEENLLPSEEDLHFDVIEASTLPELSEKEESNAEIVLEDGQELDISDINESNEEIGELGSGGILNDNEHELIENSQPDNVSEKSELDEMNFVSNEEIDRVIEDLGLADTFGEQTPAPVSSENDFKEEFDDEDNFIGSDETETSFEDLSQGDFIVDNDDEDSGMLDFSEVQETETEDDNAFMESSQIMSGNALDEIYSDKNGQNLTEMPYAEENLEGQDENNEDSDQTDFAFATDNGVGMSKKVVAGIVGGLVILCLVGIGAWQLIFNNKSANLPGSDVKNSNEANVSEFDFGDVGTNTDTENNSADADNVVTDLEVPLQTPTSDDVDKTADKITIQKIKKDFSKPDTYISVSKIVWDVPEYLTYNDDFNTYLQTVGSSLKINISSDLLLINESPILNNVKLKVSLKNSGNSRYVDVVQGCGVSSIDNLVLQSVKKTMDILKPPVNSLNTADEDLYLTICL